jgi:hypothetical protein
MGASLESHVRIATVAESRNVQSAAAAGAVDEGRECLESAGRFGVVTYRITGVFSG